MRSLPNPLPLHWQLLHPPKALIRQQRTLQRTSNCHPFQIYSAECETHEDTFVSFIKVRVFWKFKHFGKKKQPVRLIVVVGKWHFSLFQLKILGTILSLKWIIQIEKSCLWQSDFETTRCKCIGNFCMALWKAGVRRALFRREMENYNLIIVCFRPHCLQRLLFRTFVCEFVCLFGQVWWMIVTHRLLLNPTGSGLCAKRKQQKCYTTT